MFTGAVSDIEWTTEAEEHTCFIVDGEEALERLDEGTRLVSSFSLDTIKI